jgi:hypothetical protein
MCGLAFQPGLDELLISASESSRGALPLLQFLLLRLYEARKQGFLTHQAMRKQEGCGGCAGEVG